MNKSLKKAIMKRTQLANKYHKHSNEENLKKIKKQNNFVNRLYKREKKTFYQKLSLNDLQDNKKFWKNMKPLLSDKNKGDHRITLVKGNDIVSEDKEIAADFSNFFSNAVKNLHIPEIEVSNVDHLTDLVDISIGKHKNHPSVLKIKEVIGNINTTFEFHRISEEEVIAEFKSLETGKSTTFNHIPGNILKDNVDIYYEKVTKIINDNIENNNFPDTLKLADVNPIFKKDHRTNVENYRPVSVLTYTSKIFERILQNQILEQMNGHLSKNLCGYRKGFSTQHALISMTERIRKSLDEKGFSASVLMDLSKAFDCMDHELLLAKLDAYGYSKGAIKMIHSYLNNRWQRVKIHHSFSPWEELLLGVPQGSVLGPILFNIFLNDLLWFINKGEVCNYADDTTLYGSNKDLNILLNNLELDCSNAIKWFKMNSMRLNPDKCKLIVFGQKDHPVTVKVGEFVIKEQNEVELLGVIIDNKLTFWKHLKGKIKKANRKLAVIKRNQSYLQYQQKKAVLSSFVHSQLAHAPLVWMFHTKDLNHRINKIQERALRLLYNDEGSNFSELLQKDGSFTIHERNIQILLIEMFKAKNKLEPSLLREIFQESDYKGPELRSSKCFLRPSVRTQKYGVRSLQNLGVILWNQLPKNIQEEDTLNKFKSYVKKWRPIKCPCDLCGTYLRGLGKINLCNCNNC